MKVNFNRKRKNFNRKLGPLSMNNLEGTPYLEIIKSTILPPFAYFMGIAFTHFVKYFIDVMINVWPSLKTGLILLIKSSAQIEKG